MSDDILNRILAEVQENRAETRRLGEETRRLGGRMDHLESITVRLVATVDRVEGKTDRLVGEMEDVRVRLHAVESAVVGSFTTGVSQSHRLDSLDLRMKLIERRLELRDTP